VTVVDRDADRPERFAEEEGGELGEVEVGEGGDVALAAGHDRGDAAAEEVDAVVAVVGERVPREVEEELELVAEPADGGEVAADDAVQVRCR
jgi:hypothetical protein